MTGKVLEGMALREISQAHRTNAPGPHSREVRRAVRVPERAGRRTASCSAVELSGRSSIGRGQAARTPDLCVNRDKLEISGEMQTVTLGPVTDLELLLCTARLTWGQVEPHFCVSDSACVFCARHPSSVEKVPCTPRPRALGVSQGREAALNLLLNSFTFGAAPENCGNELGTGSSLTTQNMVSL